MGFKLVRALLGMTQQELASTAGIARPTLVRWEKEDSLGDGLQLNALIAILKAIEDKYNCGELYLSLLSMILAEEDKPETMSDRVEHWKRIFKDLKTSTLFRAGRIYLKHYTLTGKIPNKFLDELRAEGPVKSTLTID